MVLQERKPRPQETEWSKKSDELVELSGDDLEPIDEPVNAHEQPKRAEIATAYGGSVANEKLGNARQTSMEKRVTTEKNKEEKEQLLRAQGQEDVRKKLENGMSTEDLLDLIEGELEEIEYDIDDLEEDGNQEVILKNKYMRRSVLDAQKQEVQKYIARKEAA